MKVTKHPVRLQASATAIITQFLLLPGENRVSNVTNHVIKLSEYDAEGYLNKVMKEYAHRHQNIRSVFMLHYERINHQSGNTLTSFTETKKLLLGACFTKEYSIQAAALFNPSIVPHPNQKLLNNGEVRFVMSLRATGEGHISSVVFHTGIIDQNAKIKIDPPTGYFTPIRKHEDAVYTKDFISKRAALSSTFNMHLLDYLPEKFTAADALSIMQTNETELQANQGVQSSVAYLQNIFDTNYELENSSSIPINEKVIFPNAKAESMGIEDVRFVKFQDGDYTCYYGTYTAYNGKEIKTQLIETIDFNIFKIRSLYGAAASDKGMALFPEKVNGKYVMISRQGGETINIMFSDDIHVWNDYQLLMEPFYSWEMVQLGNCGSPIKTNKGWLLLTHGVGAMRTYVISAILLDLNNPSKIIGRLEKPLIEADETEREGYVPNVVYTCGFMQHNDMLIIPYALSDSATSFATIGLDEILNEMKMN
jgi:predicted GH43/DUF377 family glycosyl hydrolase